MTDEPIGSGLLLLRFVVPLLISEQGVPISPSQVWQIFDALDLKPWQT